MVAIGSSSHANITLASANVANRVKFNLGISEVKILNKSEDMSLPCKTLAVIR